jgi:hypothetical protein
MLSILHLLGTFVANLFKSRRRLEVENLFLRHQLNIALRHTPQRLRLHGSDRASLAWMTWLWPSLLGLARVVQPDTILRWHRAGFRAYWRWKSRGRPGRPRVCCELRELIRRMSKEKMLPILSTPFGSANLRASVAMLLPVEPPPMPPVNIPEAMSEGWLELWYQPKINVRRVAVDGAEALIRIRHPTWGIVTPAYFIPDDADPQLRALSVFVIDQSIKDWHEFVGLHGAIEIAINIPMAFFQHPDAIGDLCKIGGGEPHCAPARAAENKRAYSERNAKRHSFST